MTARNESNSAERMAYFDTRAAIAFYQGKYTEADRDWQQAAKSARNSSVRKIQTWSR